MTYYLSFQFKKYYLWFYMRIENSNVNAIKLWYFGSLFLFLKFLYFFFQYQKNNNRKSKQWWENCTWCCYFIRILLKMIFKWLSIILILYYFSQLLCITSSTILKCYFQMYSIVYHKVRTVCWLSGQFEKRGWWSDEFWRWYC